jgi:hypothetical protein
MRFFKYLFIKFSRLSYVKTKNGVLVGPQILKPFYDDELFCLLRGNEKALLSAFQSVVNNLLKNNRADNYQEIVEKCLEV